MHKISANQLRHMLQQGQQPLLLDVRDPYELTASPGKIEGVVNIPLAKLADRLEEIRPHAGAEVVIICRSGARALAAAKLLDDNGFASVAVLEGGMLAWREV